VKHAVIGFSSVTFPLTLFLAGLVAAQSAQPRKDIPTIAKAANGAIVSIITSAKDGRPVAQGTGFLVSTDGRIVTNYHVVKGASSAIVKLPNGAFYDVDGVVAFDKARDLAVIKAHGQNFRVVTLGNSDRIQVGEEIVAIGSPLSLESTVSSGIVSGIRTIKEEGGKFLQITAPISPGSSGGPLFNMAGEVVGITTLYLEGGENLNFAIPVNDAKRLLSAGSKVRDFPVETSDPLANLGTPATPNAAPPNGEGKTPLKFISRDLGIYTFGTGNLTIKAACVGTVDEYHPDVQAFCNLAARGESNLEKCGLGNVK
jgi:S1-C subfamily serine protease